MGNVVYVEGHYYPGHGYWRHGHWYNNNNAIISYVDGHYYPGHGYWRHGHWYNDNGLGGGAGHHTVVHHDEPRVVHDTPMHHNIPHITYPHGSDWQYAQEEPHVEFDHDHEHGPVGYEPAQYIPAHTQRGYHQIHHFVQ